jgi:hypothetical protein
MTGLHKASFQDILIRVRRSNVRRIRDRAFAANRIAKLSTGHSRAAAYALKDRAIGTLVMLGEGRILRLYGRPIGVAFRDGGQLHLKVPSDADSEHYPVWSKFMNSEFSPLEEVQ